MNSLLRERRTIAERFAHHLVEHENIIAVLVFGSVASGHVDAVSDIDMLVVCEPDIPSEVARRGQLGVLGESWVFGAPLGDPMFPVVDECRSVDGVAVTLHYQRASWIEQVLDEVLIGGAITTEKLPFRPYTLAGLLSRAWVLADAQGIVAGWRARTESFPPTLRCNLLEHFTPILSDHTSELVANAQREIGTRVVLFNLNWAVDALIGILYALNSIYDPADRRAERTIWPTFRVAPESFSARLSEILSGPFDEGTATQKAKDFEMLAGEVLELVQHS